MAAKAGDPRAKAVLTTAPNVWRSPAKQRSYQGQSKRTAALVDQLDTAIIDRKSRENDPNKEPRQTGEAQVGGSTVVIVNPDG
jgi:hypothetical protein